MTDASGDKGGVDVVVEAGREGPVLRVRVRPGSSRRGVLGTREGMLIVAVGAPPEGGRATAEAIRTVGSWLGIAPSRLSLASGAASRTKRIRVAGMTAPGLRSLVAEKLGG